MSFRIEYFNERVEATIADWPEDILADYARLIKLLADQGPDLRMPHSRAFGDGLFELRAKSAAGIGRAFYCFLRGRRITVLHSFIKKTQQTPASELKIARQRQKVILQNVRS